MWEVIAVDWRTLLVFRLDSCANAFEELVPSTHFHLLSSSLSLDHHHDVDRTALDGLP